jgi:hypothetical protein
LVYDGVPASQLYGSDLRPEFFELGYELFRDRSTLTSTFIAADVFEKNSGLQPLEGNIDILFMSRFLHLFGRVKQVEICQRAVEILRPVSGSLVLGLQVGDLIGGEVPHTTNAEGIMMRHNVESFTAMWDEVGKLTNTSWKVEARLLGQPSPQWALPKSTRLLCFAVFRL